MNFSIHCVLLASFVIICNCLENNTDNNKTDGSTQQRQAAATGTIRNRDNTKLLSLLAARRKQMVQSRFNGHLATIAEIVETTTQLNKILGIQTSNISRIYIDARNIRQTDKRPSRIEIQVENGGESTENYKNESDTIESKTTEYFNKNIEGPAQIPQNIKTTDNNVNSQQHISEINKNNYFSNPAQFKYVTNNPPKFILKSRKITANSVESKILDQKSSIGPVSVQTEPINESMTTDFPLGEANKNAIINKNRKLPIDLDQISRDTYGLSEDKVRTDNYDNSSDDLLEVNESNHGLYVLNFVEKNSTSSSNQSTTDDIDIETTTIDVQTNNVNYSLDESEPTKETNFAVSFNEEKTDNQNNKKEPTEDTVTFDKEKSTNTTHFMSESLYNYFRPLEMNLPAEEIQPFLHFGQKIGVSKPNLTRNQIYKPQNNRPTYRSQNNQATTSRNIENSEQSLMDLSVERQNIANKVVNLRSVTPTRHIDGARGYFRSRNYTSKIGPFKSNNTRVNPDLTTDNKNISETRTTFNSRINKTNQESGNKADISTIKLNDTRTDSAPNIQKNRIHRLRESYLSNPNRAYFILSKRNATLRQNRDNNNNTENIQSNLDDISRRLIPNNSQLLLNQTNSNDETESIIIKRHDVLENSQNRSEQIENSNAQGIQNTTVTTGNTPVLTTRILSTNVVTSVSVKSSSGRKDALVLNDTSMIDKTNNTNTNTSIKDVRTTTRFQIIVPDIEVTTNEMQADETTISSVPQIPEEVSHTTSSTSTEKIVSTTENKTFKPIQPITRKPELIIKVENVSKVPVNIQPPAVLTQKVVETDWSSIFSEPKVTVAPKIQTSSTTTSTVASTSSTTSPVTTQSTTTSEIPPIILSTTSVPIIQNRPSNTDNTVSASISPVSSTEKAVVLTTEAVIEIASTNFPKTTPKPITFKPWLTTSRPRYTTPETKAKTPSNIFYDQTVGKKQYNSTHIPETVILRRNNTQIENSNVAAYVLAAMGILPIAVIILLVIRNVLHNRMKAIDGESDILAESMPEREKHTPINPVAKLPMLVTDTNSIWEFPRSKLRLKTLLGEGNFGQVWKAEADDLKDHDGLTRLVAVKTIKDGAGAKEREDLYRELSIMQRLGTHQNVVQLLGCCTEKEPCLLIMEYVMYGKMLTYLRDHRTRRDYYNFSDDAATLTSRDLTVFAYCVARGMEYLASKGILHRDLAARNILVDHNKLCKISDFGMSRYSPTGEIKEPRQPKNALPVRWMATESLMYSLFTEKTDVWSFGILLWEIVTLGATPYATMSGREVMHCVCDGYRLERPSHCKPEIYRLMERTWLSDPNSRPNFSELRHEIAELLENNSIDYSYVDLESFAADSNIYEITNVNSRGNYCTVKSRISEFECDI